MTEPQSQRPPTQPEQPPGVGPFQAPLDYAGRGLDRRRPPLWRQMLESVGFLAVALAVTVVVAWLLEGAYTGPRSSFRRIHIAQATLAVAAVSFVTALVAAHRRRAWRGMLLVLLLGLGLVLLLVGWCFAAFTGTRP